MDKEQQNTSDPGLSDKAWAWVSQQLDNKDSVRMKGYSEDIDSLLTLDGLFSGVVTGFIALSVTMLQEDSGQKSAQLLSTISTQLSSLTLTPPFMNSTVITSPPHPFQPTVASRWINCLWLVSLVLSLASAVFGILVKQWIAEYLRWNQITEDPQQNALVREIRSEAWKTWHVAVFISAVPVLLEIALILFTCGLVVFTTTLDLIVGIVIAICIGIFLSLVIAITLLPAICKHCPYKSPTSWALIYLGYQLALLYTCITGHCRHFLSKTSASSDEQNKIGRHSKHFSTAHSSGIQHETNSWRSRELTAMPFKKLYSGNKAMDSVQSVLSKELKFELQNISSGNGLATLEHTFEDNVMNSPEIISSELLSTYLESVSKADLLYKCLVKLVAELPDADGSSYIAKCTDTIFDTHSCLTDMEYSRLIPADILQAKIVIDGAFRNISVWYMLSRYKITGKGYSVGPLLESGT